MIHSDHGGDYPARVVVLGARGFIGKALCRRLGGMSLPILGLSSDDLDLAVPESIDRLLGLLRTGDAVVFGSCITPDRSRDLSTMMINLAMGRHVAEVLAKSAVEYLLYISSDAVYGDGTGLISGETKAEPSSLYGAMHLAREVMLRETSATEVGICRSSQVYGAGDSHNAYGPSRFRRMAATERRITLVGDGEELRDHILIDDLVELLMQMLRERRTGAFLSATGHSVSFAEVAGMVAAQFDSQIEIARLPRERPIQHRLFDISRTLQAFPDLRYTPIAEGIARTHRKAAGEEG